jgi:hypothetical protein
MPRATLYRTASAMHCYDVTLHMALLMPADWQNRHVDPMHACVLQQVNLTFGLLPQPCSASLSASLRTNSQPSCMPLQHAHCKGVLPLLLASGRVERPDQSSAVQVQRLGASRTAVNRLHLNTHSVLKPVRDMRKLVVLQRRRGQHALQLRCSCHPETLRRPQSRQSDIQT